MGNHIKTGERRYLRDNTNKEAGTEDDIGYMFGSEAGLTDRYITIKNSVFRNTLRTSNWNHLAGVFMGSEAESDTQLLVAKHIMSHYKDPNMSRNVNDYNRCNAAAYWMIRYLLSTYYIGEDIKWIHYNLAEMLFRGVGVRANRRIAYKILQGYTVPHGIQELTGGDTYSTEPRDPLYEITQAFPQAVVCMYYSELHDKGTRSYKIG